MNDVNGTEVLRYIDSIMDSTRIGFGGHSGGGWPILEALKYITPGQLSRVRSIVLQHAATSPTKSTGATAAEVIADMKKPVLNDKAIIDSKIQLAAVCGQACQLTCDPCVYKYVGTLKTKNTTLDLSSWQEKTCAKETGADCSDCMPMTGCATAKKYVDDAAQKTGMPGMLVSGPWVHTTPQNTLRSDKYFDQCGSTFTARPETPYVLGWLQFVMRQEASALENLLAQDGAASVLPVAQCGKTLVGPVGIQLIQQNGQLVPGVEKLGRDLSKINNFKGEFNSLLSQSQDGTGLQQQPGQPTVTSEMVARDAEQTTP